MSSSRVRQSESRRWIWTSPFSEDPRLIFEESHLVVFRNPSLAVFGAVDEMHQILHEGLGHGQSLALGRWKGMMECSSDRTPRSRFVKSTSPPRISDLFAPKGQPQISPGQSDRKERRPGTRFPLRSQP